MRSFKGIFPALVTPFNKEGDFDRTALKKLITWNMDKGVSGFYVGGSTGESYLLSLEERKAILEMVVETVNNEADVIVNIGSFSTRDGIALAKHADALKVDAISSVPPFYFKFTIDEYYRYYLDIANEVSVPMIVYNVPAMSGISFSDQDIEKFLSEERIIGMKHTSYDLFQLQQIIGKFPEKSLFIGHDEIYLSALSIGAEAAIGSTFNFMAEKFIRIQKHFQAGELDSALKLQSEANQIIQVLVKIGVFKGVKAALEMLGVPCGTCRKPFQPLSKEALADLEGVMDLL